MPLINIKTSFSDQEKLKQLLKEISICLANLTGKPEKYVMASIQSNLAMTFGGSEEHSCYIEIKSIGSLNPKKMSQEICNKINSMTGIKADRIYINFQDVSAQDWGFNGSTFG